MERRESASNRPYAVTPTLRRAKGRPAAILRCLRKGSIRGAARGAPVFIVRCDNEPIIQCRNDLGREIASEPDRAAAARAHPDVAEVR